MARTWSGTGDAKTDNNRQIGVPADGRHHRADIGGKLLPHAGDAGP